MFVPHHGGTRALTTAWDGSALGTSRPIPTPSLQPQGLGHEELIVVAARQEGEGDVLQLLHLGHVRGVVGGAHDVHPVPQQLPKGPERGFENSFPRGGRVGPRDFFRNRGCHGLPQPWSRCP